MVTLSAFDLVKANDMLRTHSKALLDGLKDVMSDIEVGRK